MGHTMRMGRLAVVLTAAISGGVGCDAALDIGLDAQADVSFEVAEGGGLFSGSEAPNEARSGGHVVTVTRATLTASRLALHGTTTAEHNNEVTFDLPVRGGIVTPVRMGVDAGTFNELELHVRTVRLRGTYDGAPFDVTVRTDARTELRLWPSVRIESGDHSNVTVRVELMDWFRAEGGGLIDPSRLMVDVSLQTQLRANLSGSMRSRAATD